MYAIKRKVKGVGAAKVKLNTLVRPTSKYTVILVWRTERYLTKSKSFDGDRMLGNEKGENVVKKFYSSSFIFSSNKSRHDVNL